MGLNLHKVVRGAINAVHPDEEVQLLHSKGSIPDENGFAVPQYERIVGAKAQVQSEGDAALFHADMAGANSVVRRFYLFAPKDFANQTAGIFRPLARSGDYIIRTDGTVWAVDAVIENFSGVNWLSVRATLQLKPPKGVEWL